MNPPANGTFLCDESSPPSFNEGPEAGNTRRNDEQHQRAQRLESIGMLASGIAHDLNNVLSPIILAAPLLRDHATNPDDLRLITSLEKSAERGVELVRQILSFAHGVGTIQHRVQVKDLLRETSTLASDTFPKNIRVVDQIPDNLWPIMADPTQIHQILLNLCVNARDAMPAGGTLTLGAENCLLDDATSSRIDGGRPGAWVVIQVEDTGTGIPDAVLSHIWEPFYTTKGAGKGTGLGLSTVRGAVANHKGFISLKTQPGTGSSFRIYLPAAEDTVPQNAQGASRPGARYGGGELILVVDDEPQIREMTAAMLSRNGYRVITAGDGTEAVALFAARRNEISMVITDLAIPHMDGIALARVVQYLNPRVKILAMSGMASAGRSGKLEEFNGAFIYKPFKAQALLEEMYNLIHPSPVAMLA
jgi:nitrogen-specific signal transduction histidine kinase/CheY-like chemotaxis protein